MQGQKKHNPNGIVKYNLNAQSLVGCKSARTDSTETPAGIYHYWGAVVLY